MAKLVFSHSFVDALARVESDRVRDRIVALVSYLETTPDMGSPDVRPMIAARFGGTVRKLVVMPFDIFYIYDPEKDEVHVDALVHHRVIR